MSMRKVPSNGSFTLSCVEHPRRDSAHPIPARIPAARSEAQQRPRQLALRLRTTWRLFPVGRQSGRPKVFQYTAINDYTRYGGFRLYTQKTRAPAICSTRRSAPRSRSHPETTGRQRHRIPTLICVHRLTGGCGRAILNLDVRCRTGKSNGVIVSMKRNYWSSRHLSSSHNVRRGFFTRSVIIVIVLQRITWTRRNSLTLIATRPYYPPAIPPSFESGQPINEEDISTLAKLKFYHW